MGADEITIGDDRGAKPGLIRFFNVSGDTALCLYLRAVRNFYMTGEPNLPANTAVLTNFGAAGDTALCCNNGMGTDFHIVSNLYQIIELDALPDDGAAHCGPVDGRISANFDFIFNNDIPNMDDFIVAPVFFWSKAKAIASDHRVGMDNAIPAYLTAVQDSGTGIDQCIRTDFGAFADIGLPHNDRTLSNLGSSLNDRGSANAHLIAEYSFIADYSHIRNTRRRLGLLPKLLQQAGNRGVHVVHPYQGSGYG